MKYGMRRHKHRLIKFLAAMLVVLGLLAAWRFLIYRTGELTTLDESSGSIINRPVPKEVISRTMIFGDVFWGRYIDDWAKQTNQVNEYPFSGLNTMSRQEYDTWIANLECPLTDKYVPSAEQDRDLSFSCPKNYVGEAAKWFTAFSLANNHTDNQEDVSGFDQTKQALNEAGIQYFGHYNPEETSSACEILSLPARYKMNDGSFKQANMPLALCGVNHVSKLPDQDLIDEIKRYSTILPVWVYGHMGTEYTTDPSPIQQQVYRGYIDAGADMVIGSHPHRVQTAENYKGKLIIYSLGNFIFDQLGAEEHGGREVWRGMGLGVEVSVAMDNSVLLWTRLSEECRSADDTCADKSAYQGLVRPNYQYKFSVVTTDNSAKGVAKKASEEWHGETLERLAWPQLLLSFE